MTVIWKKRNGNKIIGQMGIRTATYPPHGFRMSEWVFFRSRALGRIWKWNAGSTFDEKRMKMGVYRTSPRSATQKRRIRDVFFSSAKETAKAFDALNALFCGFDFSRVWNPSNVFPFLHYSSKRNFTAGWLFKTYGFVFSFFFSLSLSVIKCYKRNLQLAPSLRIRTSHCAAFSLVLRSTEWQYVSISR